MIQIFRWRSIMVVSAALAFVLALSVASIFIQPRLANVPLAHAQANSLSIGAESVYLTANQMQNKANGFTSPDSPLGCISASGGQIDCYGSNAMAYPNDTFKSTGTPGDPLNSIDYSSTSISGQPGTCNYANVSTVYKDAGSGTLIGFGHCERWPQGNGAHFWASIFLAFSTDNGASWTWKDEIVQHASAYNPNNTSGFNEAGPGVYALYNPPDNPNTTYFYIYTEDQYNGANYITVARATVAAVVNAVNSHTTLPTFMRWYNNSWSQPAAWINGHNGTPQGGYFQDVGIHLPGDNAPDSIMYDGALGQFVMGVRSCNVQEVPNCSGNTYQIDLVTSANPVDFGTAATVYAVTNASANAVYAGFIGSSNAPGTQANSDGSFYMYYTAWPIGTSLGSNQTYTARRLITLGSSQSVSGQHKFQIASNGTTFDLQLTQDTYTTCNCTAYNVAATPDSWNSSYQVWTFVNVGGNQYKLTTNANDATFDLQLTQDTYTTCNCTAYNVVATPDSWNSSYQVWTLVNVGGSQYKLETNANGTLFDLQLTNETYTGCNCTAYNVVATPDSWNSSSQVWTLT